MTSSIARWLSPVLLLSLGLLGCDPAIDADEDLAEGEYALSAWTMSSVSTHVDVEIFGLKLLFSDGVKTYATSKIPGSAVTTLCSSCGTVTDITTDGNYVYYGDTSLSTHRIRRVPIGGGSPQTLASTANINPAAELQVDASYVYWATNLGVWRAPKAGGTPKQLTKFTIGTITTTGEVASLYHDGTYYYYSVGDIYRVNASTGASTLVALPVFGGKPRNMIVANGWLYFNNDGGIYRVAASGGQSTPVISAGGKVLSFGTDTYNIFWLEDRGTSIDLNRQNISDPYSRTTLYHFVPSAHPAHLRVDGPYRDGTFLYWGDSSGVTRSTGF